MKQKKLFILCILAASVSTHASPRLNDEQIMQLGIFHGVLDFYSGMCSQFPANKAGQKVLGIIDRSGYTTTNQYELSYNMILEQLNQNPKVGEEKLKEECENRFDLLANNFEQKLGVLGLK